MVRSPTRAPFETNGWPGRACQASRPRQLVNDPNKVAGPKTRSSLWRESCGGAWLDGADRHPLRCSRCLSSRALARRRRPRLVRIGAAYGNGDLTTPVAAGMTNTLRVILSMGGIIWATRCFRPTMAKASWSSLSMSADLTGPRSSGVAGRTVTTALLRWGSTPADGEPRSRPRSPTADRPLSSPLTDQRHPPRLFQDCPPRERKPWLGMTPEFTVLIASADASSVCASMRRTSWSPWIASRGLSIWSQRTPVRPSSRRPFLRPRPCWPASRLMSTSARSTRS